MSHARKLASIMLTACLAGAVGATVLSGGAAQAQSAALTPQQVVDNINIITKMVSDADSALAQLSTSTPGNEVTASQQTLVSNLNTMLSSLSGDISALQETPPIASSDTQPIADALTNQVPVVQRLLANIIGKHNIFAQFGLTAPIAAVLRSFEASTDSFAFALSNAIPSAADDVKAAQNNMDHSVGSAIAAYQDACIPSPLYPVVLPVCVGV